MNTYIGGYPDILVKSEGLQFPSTFRRQIFASLLHFLHIGCSFFPLWLNNPHATVSPKEGIL